MKYNREPNKRPAALNSGDYKVDLLNDTSTQERYQDAFIQAMKNSGIICNEPLIADGQLHRFSVGGKREKDGWYVLYGMAGAFGDWSQNISEKWSSPKTNRTSADNCDQKEQIEKAKRVLQSEKEERHRAAALKAEESWMSLSNVGHSPYLAKKHVDGFGVKYENTTLVVPIRDKEGQLVSLQWICEDGKKRFLTGGRLQGCFHVIGVIKVGVPIYVVEGYATRHFVVISITP